MLLVWNHTEKNPDLQKERQERPVVLKTDNFMDIAKLLGSHPEWQGRTFFLHVGDAMGSAIVPQTASACIGWGRLPAPASGYGWVVDEPWSHGFCRDELLAWIERGGQWTSEQKSAAYDEFERRGWKVDIWIDEETCMKLKPGAARRMMDAAIVEAAEKVVAALKSENSADEMDEAVEKADQEHAARSARSLAEDDDAYLYADDEKKP